MRVSAARKTQSDTPPAIPDEFYTDLAVGEILRRARLARGIEVGQAAWHLHIRAEHLQALERSDFYALPGRVFVIGFIRTYAEYLGLDGGRVVHLLKRQSRGLGTPQSLNMHYLPSDNRLPSVPILAAAGAAFLIVLTLWGVYQSVRIGAPLGAPSVPAGVTSLRTLENQVASETAAEASASAALPAAVPVPAAMKEVIDRVASGAANGPAQNEKGGQQGLDPARSSEEGQGPASSPKDKTAAVSPLGVPSTAAAEMPEDSISDPDFPAAPVVVRVMDDSWIELRAPNGRVVQARLFRAGEDIPLDNPVDQTGNPFRISVGNAGGVQVVVNGKPMPPLGADAQVRRNISLDPAAF